MIKVEDLLNVPEDKVIEAANMFWDKYIARSPKWEAVPEHVLSTCHAVFQAGFSGGCKWHEALVENTAEDLLEKLTLLANPSGGSS